MAPEVHIYQTCAMYLGPSFNLEPHRVSVTTIAVGLEEPFSIEIGDVQESRRSCIIEPNTRHHLRPSGRMVFVYLDPTIEGDLWAVAESIEEQDGSSSFDLRKVLADAGLSLQRGDIDRRVKLALEEIDLDPAGIASIQMLAQRCGLSASRLQHLFQEEGAIPFRRYRLWRRMSVVAKELAKGRTITSSCLEAGFSTPSHFSTAFLEMFGLQPSRLLDANTVFKVIEQSELT